MTLLALTPSPPSGGTLGATDGAFDFTDGHTKRERLI